MSSLPFRIECAIACTAVGGGKRNKLLLDKTKISMNELGMIIFTRCRNLFHSSSCGINFVPNVINMMMCVCSSHDSLLELQYLSFSFRIINCLMFSICLLSTLLCISARKRARKALLVTWSEY